MSDRLVRGLVRDRGLRVACTRVTDNARIARMLHGCYPTSAILLAEALAAGVILGALQKERGRVNLQLECDGPVGGLLVDADTEGNVRCTLRRPEVHFPGDAAAGVRAALGRSGFVSVIRDLGAGQFYRGSVELPAPDLAEGLRRYFAESEQVATALDLEVVPRGDEPLGEVAGLLVQRLPDGSEDALQEARRRLSGGALRRALERGAGVQQALCEAVGGDFELLADLEVAYRCGCNRERARAAVSALGAEGIREVLAGERQAVITCEFCRQRYRVDEGELADMARRLEAQESG